MAILEALFEDPDANLREGWQRVLPVNAPLKLGRDPTRSDLWVPDRSISGIHVQLLWDGTTLAVSEWTDPPPRNRNVYFQAKYESRFTLRPGDGFVISKTIFTLKDPSVDLGPQWGDHDIAVEALSDRRELRDTAYANPAAILAALEELPEILRLAPTEDMMLKNVADLLLKALRGAAAAAVVRYQPDAGADRVQVLFQSERPAAGPQKPFVASRRLVEKASINRQSVLHVWGPGEGSEMTLRHEASGTLGVPWAVCAPLQDESGLSLYLDGVLPRNPIIKAGRPEDGELTDYRKVADLVAGILESTRKAHDLERLLSVYRRFLPKKLRGTISPKQLDDMLQPRAVEVTVLFCDIRGSCQIADGGGDAALTDAWQKLAAAIDDMTQSITEQEGVVAGFQGDAVMAFWGWPLDQPDQSERAARAALRICERFDEFGWFRTLRCGLGIARGTAVAGRLGAHDLAKVDVFGPVVNLASRLETMTKQFGVRVLTDDATAAGIKAANRRYRTRRLATVRPVGMTAGVAIHELLGGENDPIGGMRENVRRNWEEAVGWFLAGDWPRALAQMTKYHATDPAAKKLVAYMDKSDREAPPGWDGVMPLELK